MDKSELQHQIISIIKEFAHSTGHPPSRREYLTLEGAPSERQVANAFGLWSEALRAAGFSGETRKSRPKTPPLAELLYKPVEEAISRSDKRVLRKDPFVATAVCGDLHFPFTNRNCLSNFYAFLKGHPEIKQVVQVGDLYDMYSHAKFPRSRNIYNPKEEIELGRSMAEEFWQTVQKMRPGVKCHQILGNHDVRPIKRVIESYPEAEIFMNFSPIFEFPGVETIHDARQELILDNIIYIHGYSSKLGAHMNHYSKSVVCGHSHRGGVVYQDHPTEGIIFELNAGFMGDVDSKVLSYTPMQFTKWTHGFGYIDKFGPRFIPL